MKLKEIVWSRIDTLRGRIKFCLYSDKKRVRMIENQVSFTELVID